MRNSGNISSNRPNRAFGAGNWRRQCSESMTYTQWNENDGNKSIMYVHIHWMRTHLTNRMDAICIPVPDLVNFLWALDLWVHVFPIEIERLPSDRRIRPDRLKSIWIDTMCRATHEYPMRAPVCSPHLCCHWYCCNVRPPKKADNSTDPTAYTIELHSAKTVQPMILLAKWPVKMKRLNYLIVFTYNQDKKKNRRKIRSPDHEMRAQRSWVNSWPIWLP